ncbi:MAG: hypothetical protein IJC63_06470 [Myxococcaceae bacterium]|nr:hypothetical protein [Myxococcaceae bacterium]
MATPRLNSARDGRAAVDRIQHPPHLITPPRQRLSDNSAAMETAAFA